MNHNSDRGRTDIRLRFGMAAKTCRRERGITQEELAERAGLSQTYIAEVELGKRNISLVNIERLTLALGFTMGTFFSEYLNRDLSA